MRASRLISVLLFFLAATSALFWNLHRVPLFDPDEGRYADIALTMVKTGDWVTPRMNYIKHLHKPPLSSWLVAVSFKLLGPSEFSARLPNVLLSLVLLGGMILLGKFLFDFRTGLYGAWILLTSVLYFAASRIVTPDLLLTFLIFASMSCLACLFFDTRFRLLWFYVTALSLGLGMLTKGPVIWMIVLLPAVVFSVWKKRRIHIPWKHWVLAGIPSLAISLSWYVLIANQNAGGLGYFLHSQLLGRILKGTSGHAYPFYYYLIVMPMGFFPWTLLMPSAIAWNLKKKNHSPGTMDRIHFLFLWFLIPFVLFSLFRTKLATYIVPLYPPLVLLGAHFWKEFDLKKVKITRPLLAGGWMVALSFGLFLIAGLIFIRVHPEFVGGIPAASLVAGGVVLFVSTLLLVVLLLQKKWDWLFRFVAGGFFVVTIMTLGELPLIRFKNTKDFADKVRELRRPGDIVLMFDHYFPSLPFYLDERVLTVGVEDLEHTFESPESVKEYVIFGEGGLTPLTEGPKRILALTDEEGYSKARALTSFPLYPMLKQQKMILFSNRPE